jgi:hypothetical protein
LGSAIDGRALLWTLQSLDEDVDLERFFAAIPCFCDSRKVVDPVGTFIKPNDKKISATLIQFMERTLSSNLISESVKQTRIAICRMTIDAASLSASRQILDRVLLRTWNELLYSIGFALSARRWGIGNNPSIDFRAQRVAVVVLVIVFFQGRDDRWGNLAIDQLGISRSVLEQYLAHGDSMLLANFIYITQKIFLYHSENGDWSLFHGVSLRTLETASRSDARRTLPQLQHEFVTCGTDLFSPHGTTTIPTPDRPLSEYSNEFATFTSPCVKESIPRDRHSPNFAMMILRSIWLPLILCAILTTIFQLSQDFIRHSPPPR